MKISVHSLVKNEERFLWFSVMSVINHVDEILLWDTGSTDGSIEIEKELQRQFPDKIKLRFFNDVDKNQFTVLRQKILDETKSDWILLLDGDEVWWEESIRTLLSEIYTKGNNLDSIVSPFTNLVGDIYHYQDETAGRYSIDGRVGNFTIRAFRNNIAGIHFEKPCGKEGLFYEDGTTLQEGNKEKRVFCGAPFLHFTHLTRSDSSKSDNQVLMRGPKFKYEIGNVFPKDYYYPEVFFKPRLGIVKSPWKAIDSGFISRALIETPLRKIKRKILNYEY